MNYKFIIQTIMELLLIVIGFLSLIIMFMLLYNYPLYVILALLCAKLIINNCYMVVL